MSNHKKCVKCKKEYKPRSPHHMFCSRSCQEIFNKGRTWTNFLACLLNNNPNRKKLSTEILLEIFEKQGGKCAVSGVPLTKITGKGVVPTNASIDRVRAGGKYTKNNIRLVCHFVNTWRGKVTDKELLWWSERIMETLKPDA